MPSINCTCPLTNFFSFLCFIQFFRKSIIHKRSDGMLQEVEQEKIKPTSSYVKVRSKKSAGGSVDFLCMTNFCIIIVKVGIKSAILAVEAIVKIVKGRLRLFLFLISGECKSFNQPINYFFGIVTLFFIFQFCQKKDNLLVFVDNFRKFYYRNKKK